MPSVLFVTRTGFVKFLFVILQNQFLHGGIIVGVISKAVVVSDEGDLSQHISQTIYFYGKFFSKRCINIQAQRWNYGVLTIFGAERMHLIRNCHLWYGWQIRRIMIYRVAYSGGHLWTTRKSPSGDEYG